MIDAVNNYVDGRKNFSKTIEELSNINLEVETITREFEDNKLYIKNNLKVTKETLKDKIFNLSKNNII